MNRIVKPTIIITSTGRTGTKFFARLFAEIYPSGTSLHEPDILTIGRQSSLAKQINEIGLMYFLRKLLFNWSVAEISDARITGSITKEKAIHQLLAQRKRFIESRPGPLYIESSFGFYGLIDLLGETFNTCRSVYIIRDGREWVRSFMDRGLRKRNPTYNKSPLMRALTHSWPDAKQFKGNPYQEQWQHMTRFQKLCWAWSTLNSRAIEAVKGNQNCILVKFEDIFTRPGGDKILSELIQFTSEMHQIEPRLTNALADMLEIQPNVSMNQYPSWEQWTREQQDFFRETCTSLMDNLGYHLG